MLTKDYLEHRIFNELDDYINFYNHLSFLVFRFIPQGVQAVFNVDSYIYSSTKGTLESIRDLLLKARLNDVYCLLRKYFDSVIINIYPTITSLIIWYFEKPKM